MHTGLILATPLAALATAARADAGGTFDGATLAGMLLLIVLATALLRVGLREWRRETGRPQPLRMTGRARRYNQP